MKYSFIGLGNMASAIIAGMAASGKFKNDNIYGYNRSEGKTNTLRDRHGLIPCASALEAELLELAHALDGRAARGADLVHERNGVLA